MSEILSSSKNRFDISNEGWRRMNAGRSASDLIREAVSNTFDAETVKSVVVTLEPGAATIEDDSPTGIQDPTLVTTVFLTDKSDSPKKRGRKGRGLKELISAAEWAEVDTIGHRVTFEEGRTVTTSDRKVGTKVSVRVPAWTQGDIDQAKVYLSRIIPPPGVKFVVNGVEIKPRHTNLVFTANLKTQVVVEGVQKDAYNYSDVHLVDSSKDDSGWIYEMGIPVQAIKTPFHIDVQQRVPLNDNRDTIDTYYVTGLYAAILDVTIDQLEVKDLKSEWVQQALSWTLSVETKKKMLKKMFGEELSRLAIRSKNSTVANDIAKQHNFKLIDLAALPSSLENVAREYVPAAESIAKQIDEEVQDTIIDSRVVDPHGTFAALIRFLGKHLIGCNVQTEFFRRPKDFTGNLKLAHFKPDTKTVGFNVDAKLPLNNPLDPEILSTIVHELAHNASLEHDREFLEEVQNLAGKLASLMLRYHSEVSNIVGTAYALPTADKRTVTITCVDCGAPRDVYPQDVHQVLRCVDCTKEARKARARERRQTAKVG